MYPWEKDVFDLYDEAMERACKLAWSDDESEEEDDESEEEDDESEEEDDESEEEDEDE